MAVREGSQNHSLSASCSPSHLLHFSCLDRLCISCPPAVPVSPTPSSFLLPPAPLLTPINIKLTFEASQDRGKYFSLHNHLSQVHRMFCNLAQCRKYVSLETKRRKKTNKQRCQSLNQYVQCRQFLTILQSTVMCYNY